MSTLEEIASHTETVLALLGRATMEFQTTGVPGGHIDNLMHATKRLARIVDDEIITVMARMEQKRSGGRSA